MHGPTVPGLGSWLLGSESSQDPGERTVPWHGGCLAMTDWHKNITTLNWLCKHWNKNWWRKEWEGPSWLLSECSAISIIPYCLFYELTGTSGYPPLQTISTYSNCVFRLKSGSWWGRFFAAPWQLSAWSISAFPSLASTHSTILGLASSLPSSPISGVNSLNLSVSHYFCKLPTELLLWNIPAELFSSECRPSQTFSLHAGSGKHFAKSAFEEKIGRDGKTRGWKVKILALFFYLGTLWESYLAFLLMR